MDTVTRVTPHDAGCWVSEANWGQYSPARVADLAITWGWAPDIDDALVIARVLLDLPPSGIGIAGDDDWSALIDQGGIAEDAEEWMNNHVAPDGYYFGWHDGDFVLWPLHVWHEDDSGACDCTPEQIEEARRFL